MDKYLKFYNTPEKYEFLRKRSPRFEAHQNGKPSSEKLGSDVTFQIRKFADYGIVEYVATGEDTGDMVL